MKIVADQNIPCAAEAFAGLGEVVLRPGREIGANDLADCRCLLVRTVTRVDAALLAGSPVEFVGTATIGTDHLDLDYLERNGVAFSNAAGCNAEAAAEYVVSGLYALANRRGFDPATLTAGVVGYGNVGTRLHAKLAALGIDCRLCDPPRAASGDCDQPLVSLDEILGECDFISLHVPLTIDGDHPTFHLLDRDRLARLREGCVLVNAARGEIIDNRALAELLRAREDLCVFLDTWENEPTPDRALLRAVDLATPHIAGYSVEGRLRGTQMILDAACTHFGLEPPWSMDEHLPSPVEIDCRGFASGTLFWQRLFARHCDIGRDHDALLRTLDIGDETARAALFDGLRRVYPDRLEYPRFSLRVDRATQPAATLAELGFRLAS